MDKHEEYLYTRFKDIEENPIILDFTDMKYLGEVHLLLKKKFGLPEYYGENWDALWDCLRYLFIRQTNFLVEIHGYLTMPNDLQDYCKAMLEIFDDVHARTPNISFKFIS